MGLCVRNLFSLRCKRTSDKCLSLTHYVDLCSSCELIPNQTLHFQDSEAVIRMIIKSSKTNSSNLRQVSRTHRVDLGWPLERLSLDSSISSRYLRTTEQLADMLIKCTFTTIQWKSVMSVFHLHPPPKLNVDRNFSELCCSTVSPRTPHTTSEIHNIQRDDEQGLAKETRRFLLKELKIAPRGEKSGKKKVVPQLELKKNSAWKTKYTLWKSEEQNLTLSGINFLGMCKIKRTASRPPCGQASNKQHYSLQPRSKQKRRRKPRWRTRTQALFSSWRSSSEVLWF